MLGTHWINHIYLEFFSSLRQGQGARRWWRIKGTWDVGKLSVRQIFDWSGLAAVIRCVSEEQQTNQTFYLPHYCRFILTRKLKNVHPQFQGARLCCFWNLGGWGGITLWHCFKLGGEGGRGGLIVPMCVQNIIIHSINNT